MSGNSRTKFVADKLRIIADMVESLESMEGVEFSFCGHIDMPAWDIDLYEPVEDAPCYEFVKVELQFPSSVKDIL